MDDQADLRLAQRSREERLLALGDINVKGYMRDGRWVKPHNRDGGDDAPSSVELSGSPKQVAWATEIRDRTLTELAGLQSPGEWQRWAHAWPDNYAQDEDGAFLVEPMIDLSREVRDRLSRITSAKWWIDTRNEIDPIANLVGDVWRARNPRGNGLGAARARGQLEHVGLGSLAESV